MRQISYFIYELKDQIAFLSDMREKTKLFETRAYLHGLIIGYENAVTFLKLELRGELTPRVNKVYKVNIRLMRSMDNTNHRVLCLSHPKKGIGQVISQKGGNWFWGTEHSFDCNFTTHDLETFNLYEEGTDGT